MVFKSYKQVIRAYLFLVTIWLYCCNLFCYSIRLLRYIGVDDACLMFSYEQPLSGTPYIFGLVGLTLNARSAKKQGLYITSQQDILRAMV